MHPHEKTLEMFYTAFAALDSNAMADCYANAAELLGGSPLLRGKVQRQASASLRKYLAGPA